MAERSLFLGGRKARRKMNYSFYKYDREMSEMKRKSEDLPHIFSLSAIVCCFCLKKFPIPSGTGKSEISLI